MAKRYRVTLTSAERDELAVLLARGKADVRKLKHAQVLLRADESGAAEGAGAGPGWCDTRIAEAVGVGVATVQRVRQRFVEDGFAAALGTYRTGARVYERKLDGAQEAHLIALACGTPPEGRARWTLRLHAVRGLIGTGIKGPDDIDWVVGLLEERGIELRGEYVFLVAGLSGETVRVTNTAQIRIEETLAEQARTAALDRSGALSTAAI